MDVAYDHQFQEAVTQPKQTSDSGNDKGKEPEREKESLNDELQQAYKAISNSPWGARFGAFVGTVRKQGESYYETARKEYPAVAEQATKGFTDLKTNLVARTRSLSITGDAAPTTAASDRSGESSNSNAVAAAKAHEESLLEKLRKGASQKIAEIEAAEARADEYLVKFGSSIGGFLRDAITIAPPSSKEDKGEVVFEAKGADDAKKQIFTTRLDAQLHLLHTNHDLFRSDPSVESFKAFTEGFSAEKQTDKVASDLERYPELRSTMEKLVPGEVEYKAFWVRYYFLRNELDLDKNVVLGVITSKFPKLEDKDEMIARVNQAADYIATGTGQTKEEALQQISVSPQCGFASHAEGNSLGYEDMRKKLQLVRSIADTIWPGQP